MAKSGSYLSRAIVLAVLIAAATGTSGAEPDAAAKAAALREEARQLMQAGDYEQAAQRLREGIEVLEAAGPVPSYDTVGFFEHWIRFVPHRHFGPMFPSGGG